MKINFQFLGRYEIMEKVRNQYLDCIYRAGKAKSLLEQDRDEIGNSLQGEIWKAYRELMELELERIEQVRKDLNDEAAQDK